MVGGTKIVIIDAFLQGKVYVSQIAKNCQKDASSPRNWLLFIKNGK